jgi:hypothetical protein
LKEDDDDQADPEGWDLYIKAIEKPAEVVMKFASKVGSSNPEESAVQAKCLKFFI